MGRRMAWAGLRLWHGGVVGGEVQVNRSDVKCGGGCRDMVMRRCGRLWRGGAAIMVSVKDGCRSEL